MKFENEWEEICEKSLKKGIKQGRKQVLEEIEIHLMKGMGEYANCFFILKDDWNRIKKQLEEK